MFTITPSQMKELHMLSPGERDQRILQYEYDYHEHMRMLREAENALDPSVKTTESNPTSITMTDFTK